MEKSVKISILLEIYRDLLTEKQAEMSDLYYNQNLSLSEIGDEFNISRQAVRKSLLEAEKNLLFFEKHLKIYEKQVLRDQKIDNIIKQLKDEKLIAMIEELRLLS